MRFSKVPQRVCKRMIDYSGHRELLQAPPIPASLLFAGEFFGDRALSPESTSTLVSMQDHGHVDPFSHQGIATLRCQHGHLFQAADVVLIHRHAPLYDTSSSRASAFVSTTLIASSKVSISFSLFAVLPHPPVTPCAKFLAV